MDELMQCQTCYLTAHGVKATKYDGFGVSSTMISIPGSGFEGADVTPLTADDTALDLIALDVEDGDGVLDSPFSVARRWIDCTTMRLASLLAVIFASSMISLI